MTTLRLDTIMLLGVMSSVMNEVVDVEGVVITNPLNTESGFAEVNFGWMGNSRGTCRILQSNMQSVPTTVEFDLAWGDEESPSHRVGKTFRVADGESSILAFIREYMN